MCQPLAYFQPSGLGFHSNMRIMESRGKGKNDDTSEYSPPPPKHDENEAERDVGTHSSSALSGGKPDAGTVMTRKAREAKAYKFFPRPNPQ